MSIDYSAADEIAIRLEEILEEAVTWKRLDTGPIPQGETKLPDRIQFCTRTRGSAVYPAERLELDKDFVIEVADSLPVMGDTCTWRVRRGENCDMIQQQCQMPIPGHPMTDLDNPPKHCRACGRKLIIEEME